MNYSKRTVLYDDKYAHQTTEYSSWANMRSRCKEQYAESEYYLGNGIDVCERWSGKGGFLNFYEDMGRKPTPSHTIDRIDNSKGYYRENCRWATKREQAINRGMYRTNTSGYRGVSWYPATQRWRAYIDHRTIGYFDDATEAARAYNREALRTHGERAHTNVVKGECYAV